jgi:hypothetical protein
MATLTETEGKARSRAFRHRDKKHRNKFRFSYYQKDLPKPHSQILTINLQTCFQKKLLYYSSNPMEVIYISILDLEFVLAGSIHIQKELISDLNSILLNR